MQLRQQRSFGGDFALFRNGWCGNLLLRVSFVLLKKSQSLEWIHLTQSDIYSFSVLTGKR
jgi:hypothetical protein